MSRKLPIFYSALLLTGVNLLLRMAGTSFQVYLSRRIGAEGIGLLQLTMSVGSLAMVAGIAGIRTAAMYLTAEELGKGRDSHVSHVLSVCFVYSILCSCTTALLLYVFAPMLAQRWIGNPDTTAALRLFAAFLPTTCLCGVMTGYFTAANRIGTLAAVETAEHACSMAVTLAALTFWAGKDAGRACLSVVLGAGIGGWVTLFSLIALRAAEKPQHTAPFPIRKRLLQAAVPLALADVLRSGIGTTEHLMVPKRLALYPGEANPLAAFGIVSGMVFPILMFPACILFGLAELLIPELARCAAAGKPRRISYLVRRSLKAAMLYGVLFGGLIFLLAQELCVRLYHNSQASFYLRLYAPLIPFLYLDIITDAMTKGLGQQKLCVRYNILTSSLDVLFLFLLLPRFGMFGYWVSFTVTHLLNFVLSIRLLFRVAGDKLPIAAPVRAAFSMLAAAAVCQLAPSPFVRLGAYPIALTCLLFLCGILTREDIAWGKNLLGSKSIV